MTAANAKLPEAIADICLRRGAALVHLGSAAEYGDPGPSRVRESHLPKPQSTYGQTKLIGSHHVSAAIAAGLRGTIVRPFNIVGRGQRADQPIAELLGRMRASAPGALAVADAATARDYLRIEDVVTGIIAVASDPGREALVNLCSGCPTSLGEFLTEAARQEQRDLVIVDGERGGIRSVIGDPSLLAATWGVRLRPSLRDLVAAALAS
jgi:nucleoside-diphosphate-sugar epimerase